MRLVAEAARMHGFPSLHLEGGTALSAYFIGHRESEDLDFFGDPDFHALGFIALLAPVLEQAGFVLETVGSPSPFHARALAHEAGSGTVIKLDLGAGSSFQLAPREPTSEVITVASYRDLCAGKLHAICDRFEVRDFIDLHAILTRPDAQGSTPPSGEVHRRARAIIVDLIQSDPGLDPAIIGAAVANGRGRGILQAFPLRLLHDYDESAIQQSIRVVLEACADLTDPRLPAL
jgi:hypothetical protein